MQNLGRILTNPEHLEMHKIGYLRQLLKNTKLLSMKRFLLLLILLSTAQIIQAQNEINLADLPDVNEMIEIQSNPNADTVILALHGGPTFQLFQGDWDFMEGISTFSTVEMYQHQHLNTDIEDNSLLTLDEAIILNDTTVAMMQKVVKHFNDMDKVVVIMGHSFGAFLVNEYVDDYGLDDVHKAISLAGRINMNQEIVDAFATGFFGGFLPDGITTEIDNSMAEPSLLSTMKLQAGVGYNRWVDSLITLDLSDLMVVYGESDQAVGRLLEDEIAMLENGNAEVLGIVNGDHGSMFQAENMELVLDFIREGGAVSTSDFITDTSVKVYPTLVSETINIESNTEGRYNLLDINGQLVSSGSTASGIHQVDVSAIRSGYYIIQTVNADGHTSIQKIYKS